jgi:hypothetical protein
VRCEPGFPQAAAAQAGGIQVGSTSRRECSSCWIGGPKFCVRVQVPAALSAAQAGSIQVGRVGFVLAALLDLGLCPEFDCLTP